MKKKLKYTFYTVLFILLLCGFVPLDVNASMHLYLQQDFQLDTTRTDTTDLKYNFDDQDSYSHIPQSKESPLHLSNPDNVTTEYRFDPVTNKYVLVQKIGSLEYRPETQLSIGEYSDYEFEQAMRRYWTEKYLAEKGSATGAGLFQNLRIGGESLDNLLGPNTINIVPTGSAELIFSVNINKNESPEIPVKQRSTTTFEFDEKIMMNVNGSIGDKVSVGFSYNTEATFDFENETKLQYVGKEDEIIQKIEAGNVTLPIPGSLITGSQSLFGLKTELKFGNLTVTGVVSEQRGEKKTIEVKGGAQVQEFEIRADEYDANRHFFLSHYFREKYNSYLKSLPLITSPIYINKIEVYVTNKRGETQNTRNIVALLDLAEGNRNNISAPNSVAIDINNLRNSYPDNTQIYNVLYERISNLSGIRDIANVTNLLDDFSNSPVGAGFDSGEEYEKIETARKLKDNEFTVNRQLGYISLNFSLNSDEVLAVAYEYTVANRTFKVGELTTDGLDGDEVVILKLLKGTNLTPSYKNWDLMMKNIYGMNSYQINKEDFLMDILYTDDKTGNDIRYLPEPSMESPILLRFLGLDRVNSQNDAMPDGRYDFIEGITINSTNGRIIFPVLQPFGEDLRVAINDALGRDENDTENEYVQKYVFQELYDTTLTVARQIAEKNKFKLKGEYKSSVSSEIYLNAFNIPKGSVIVTAGGAQLIENEQYIVDYNLGRVTITDDGILSSGTPIQISLESNSLYNIQTKTLLGTHLDYRISDDFNIGATVMNLTERPLTHKVGIGDEPISNTIWGLNTSFRTESQLLTTLIDKLPLIQTKEKSSIMFDAEFAHLIPGHSKAIEEEGNAYLDDFEGSETSLQVKNFFSWVLASTPVGMFDEGRLNNNLEYGTNRAWVSWYQIDPSFLRNEAETPDHIRNNDEMRSNHFVREIYEKEIFPNKEYENNIPSAINVLNIAYHPDQRGPYNYDDGTYTSTAAGLNSDGTLRDPESRWGGIMREMPTKDFEEANVEYLEFWLMDPFVYDSASTGGLLYFNLGNISEDILKDSRKSFENGLPTPDEIPYVDTTAWGIVPDKQQITSNFDNSQEYRPYQDIGYDGLNDESEQVFFNNYLQNVTPLLTTAARLKIEQDPSNDNFKYYFDGEYNTIEADILTRYRRFNGAEGNSATSDEGNRGQMDPDIEDINSDNTLSETESYFQYVVNLHPDAMKVGQNHITDKRTAPVRFANDEYSQINWYQFRIPVREPESIIGNIQDFKSIRFMRMFLTGFEDSIILRLAKLEMVREEWRRYHYSLLEGREQLSYPEVVEGGLTVASVNIEENASKTPVNYVLPPGVDRVIDPTNPQLRELNEQSMVLKITDLADGDARAVYKNLDMDIRQYGKLKMFVHAEAIEGEILNDGDLHAFIRLGTDYRDNYYEYEIPLTLTPHMSYDNNNSAHREAVWPQDNEFIIDLDIFTNVKLARNEEMRRAGSDIDFSTVYSVYQNGKKIAILGNPNLSNVRTIMIGIRNPSRKASSLTDDGMAKSAEVWVNELRLSDFNESGGWAAKGRMSIRLADLGTVNFAGLTSTPGFGGIEMTVNERSKEYVYNYDISANMDLGRIFPEKTKLSIPVYAGVSENFINPEYNPLDPDIKLDESLKSFNSGRERDSIKHIAQDYTKRRSLNFTNVKLNVQTKKPRIYSPSNVSLSYGYNDVFSRNINTEYNLLKNYRGSLNYIYSTKPKNVAPFQKAKMFSNKAFRLIKDANFNYMPSSFSFRTNVNRYYNEIKTRNINDPDLRIDPTFSKDFTWNRDYNLKWDITRALKLDYMATNIARIDEPPGVVNKEVRDTIWNEEVWNNIVNFGRNTQFHQEVKATYRIPINKLPLLDWVNANATYTGNYNWNAGPMLGDDIDIGNTIRNSNTGQLNGQLNLLNLYNKVGYLKKVNNRFQRAQKREKEKKKVTYQDDGLYFRANRRKGINHNLKTEEVTVKVFNEQGQEVDVEYDVVSDKRVNVIAQVDLSKASVLVEGEVEKGQNPLIFMGDLTLRLMMSVRNITVAYSQTQGSEVPGYKRGTDLFGLWNNKNSGLSPGIGYVLGWQDEDLVENLISDNLMTLDTSLMMNYLMTNMENWNIRGSIEPFKGLKIDLTGIKTYSENSNRFYMPAEYGTSPYSTQVGGNYSISVITLQSAFEKINSDNHYQSEAFDNFKEYTKDISERLGKDRRDNSEPYRTLYNEDDEYKHGYGELSQDVLIPAFLAAYGIESSSTIGLDVFSRFPLPNWRITLSGLKDIPFMKKIFKSFNINHTYRSTFNVGSFVTNPYYEEGDDGYSYVKDQINDENYLPQYDINTVTINEQFSPLINFDMTFQNNLTSRLDVKKTRTLSLNFSNYQMSEMHTDEYRVSMGYRFDDIDLIFNFGDNQSDFKSDLNIMASFTLRENLTVLRKISEDIDEITAGQQTIKIGASADYLLSDRLTLRLFYDQTINEPFIETSYPTSKTSVGFSFRFTLSQ